MPGFSIRGNNFYSHIGILTCSNFDLFFSEEVNSCVQNHINLRITLVY